MYLLPTYSIFYFLHRVALLSGGGTTFPDILLSVIVFLSVTFSLLLNPLVIRYNHNGRSVNPLRLLYIILCSLNILITTIFTITVGVEIARSHEHFEEHHGLSPPGNAGAPYHGTTDNMTTGGRVVITTNSPPTTAPYVATTMNEVVHLNISQFEHAPDARETLQSVASWMLIYTSGFVSAYLVIIRYLQITRPFLDLSPIRMLQTLGVLTALQFILLCVNILTPGTRQSWSTKIAQNLDAFGWEPVPNQVFLNMLPVLVNLTAGLLSLRILSQLSREFRMTRVTKQRDRDRDRNTKAETVKILCMNGGTLVMLVAQVTQATLVPEDAEYKLVLRYVLVDVIPSFLCAFYPIVFVILTPKIVREFRWSSGNFADPHNVVTFSRNSSP